MKKSFSLVELTITISIMVMLTAAMGPALLSSQKQADIDSVSKEIRNGVINTQSLAFAPEPGPSGYYPTDYVFFLNLTGSTVPVGTINIPAYSYVILGQNPSHSWQARAQTINALPAYSFPASNPSACYHNANFFTIYFRVPDGTAGRSNYYYEDTANWNWGDCYKDGDYVELTITVAGKTKLLKINTITGETELL